MSTTDQLPSIRNRVLLVNLTFNKPQMTKTDRKATMDAEQANNAKGSLKTMKMLYPKHLIDPIVAVESEARHYLRSHAVEWGNSGMYLLDTRDYMDVRDRLEEYHVMRQHEVTKFAQNWARVMEEAEASQGMLFELASYPDVSEVVQQFTMNIHVAPMGDFTPQLFADVEEELRERIAEDVERSTREALTSAMTQPLEALFDVLINLHSKVTRENSRVHDSLMADMERAANLLERMNLLDLPHLQKVAEVCRQHLVVPVESIRGKDAPARAKLAKSSEQVLGALGMDRKALDAIDTPKARREAATAAAQAIAAKMEGLF